MTTLRSMLDQDAVAAISARRAMNPDHPHQQGTAQNPDIVLPKQGSRKRIRITTQPPPLCRRAMDEFAQEIRTASITCIRLRGSAPDADRYHHH